MRIIMVFEPQSISLRPATMFLRACSLSSGATASSRSRKIMSAAPLAAFSNSEGVDPGPASPARAGRGACAKLREAGAYLAGAALFQHHVAGQVKLLLDHGEDHLAHALVLDET